jgi:hypothetical protein
VRRAELAELHFIAPISNVRSILQHGILSHVRAAQVQHASVAMAEIQDRRDRVRIPGGRPLHEYANLYINVRNKMMFKITRSGRDHLSVLRIDIAVLDLPGAIVSDQNAASGHARFAPAPQGLALVEREGVFARSWTHSDPIEQMRRGAAVNAEVLVPDRVEPRHILGAFVASPNSQAGLRAVGFALPITLNPDIFFG